MKKIVFLILFVGFSYQSMAQMTILPVFGDKPITEETWFVTKNGDSIQLENIRFYLSNIQFEMKDKSIVSDSGKAHLVDVFEPNTLTIAFKKVNLTQVKTIRFNIGIDSVTNVSGALGGDLDPQKGMYWAWQSGYINMKIEGKSPQSKNRKNVFQYHIGGYLQPFYSVRSLEWALNDQNTYQNPKPNTQNAENTEGVVMIVDMSKFFKNIYIATQNSIMMPCKEAMQLADYSIKMFSIYVQQK
jgi:hypothetical protein